MVVPFDLLVLPLAQADERSKWQGHDESHNQKDAEQGYLSEVDAERYWIEHNVAGPVDMGSAFVQPFDGTETGVTHIAQYPHLESHCSHYRGCNQENRENEKEVYK